MSTLGPPPFSVKTLAERWGCSKQHIYDLIDEGKLRTFSLGDKLTRIAAEEVARWEASTTRQPTDSESSKDASSSPGARTASDAAFASARESRGLKLVQS